MLFSVAALIGLATLGLELGDRALEHRYIGEVETIPLMDGAAVLDQVGSDMFRDAPLTFDPIEPSTDAQVWVRENGFNLAQNTYRFGHGPVLREQISQPSDPGAFRVLVLGDSWVWGQGVEDADMRWWRVLEQRLNKSGNGRHYEVTALARLGASFMEETDWLTKQRIESLNPDVIVFGFINNDNVPSFQEKARSAASITPVWMMGSGPACLAPVTSG